MREMEIIKKKKKIGEGDGDKKKKLGEGDGDKNK